MKTMRTCEKCQTDKWLDAFREYAPGKHRYTCKACENVKQKIYQKRYDEKKRDQARIDRLVAENSAIAALTERVERLERLLKAAGLANP